MSPADHPRYTRQVELENEALAMGIKRYEEGRQLDETNTRPGQRLVMAALQPLVDAIEAWCAKARSGVPTKNATSAYFLDDIDVHTVAWLTAKKVIGSMVKRESLQGVAMSITAHLEDVVNFANLERESPNNYARLMEKIKTMESPGYRHVVLRKQLKFANIRRVKWGATERVSLGLLLIDLMEKHVIVNGSPLFHRILNGVHRKAVYVLEPSDSAANWLEESHARCALLEPMHMPMVIPPLDWSNMSDGGYITKPLKYILVKSKGKKNTIAELDNLQLPIIYGAINHLQQTKWRVNKPLVAIMRDAWQTNSTLGKLPRNSPLPIPPDAPSDASALEIKASRGRKAAVYNHNRRNLSKRLAMGSKLWLADKFAEFPEIYFPHAIDWRTRAYPVAGYMHPQADDTGKALLEFGTGVALGEDGAYWLAVHGANCYGVDKVSLDDRVQWVLDHEAQILESAMNPLDGSTWWAQSDDAPWMFLAFCLEWAGYVMGGRKDSYVSHTVVSFDGSCNGLQHYSMMLRDEVGGCAVNLAPAGLPSDIYMLVARKAEELVAVDALAGDKAAQAWKGKIIRKIAKRPTMTMPYGAQQFGYKDQIIEDLDKIKMDTGMAYLGEADPFVCARYLATIMPKALSSIVVKAAEAMQWLHEAARIAAKDDLPIRWHTPIGYPVVQDYRKTIAQRINLSITGQRIVLMLKYEGDELNRRKQSSGIAPNFVHSLDASHMMLTTVACRNEGINSLAMVHDSYGTHAGHAGRLGVLLRESFVELYSTDVLSEFRDELIAQLPPALASQIPPVPAYGHLELTGVLSSDYFFA